MTLCEHPLNDLHPLAFGDADNALIDSSLDLIYVAPNGLPFALVYNPKTKGKVNFCLINQSSSQSSPGQEVREEEAFIRNLKPESRHP